MSRSRTPHRLGLAWKLFLSFTLVLITALGVLAVFISKTAEREVRGYLLRSGITDTSHLVDSLSEHYQDFRELGAGRGPIRTLGN